MQSKNLDLPRRKTGNRQKSPLCRLSFINSKFRVICRFQNPKIRAEFFKVNCKSYQFNKRTITSCESSAFTAVEKNFPTNKPR